MEIFRGIQRQTIKALVYGPEGVGKTIFASNFPDPVFIDTEGGTKWYDVARYPEPQGWQMLLEEVRAAKNDNSFQTLVIDTADWAEKMCIRYVLDKAQKSGIEDFGYGKGYVYVAEEFGRLVNELTGIWNGGKNVLLTAHAATRKFEQPDEMGAYDRYEMKIDKRISSMLKEWADIVLFANYKTLVITDDNKKKHANGSKRVMYTTHHACWDAKNRFGLKEELPFEFSQIAHIFSPARSAETPFRASAVSREETSVSNSNPASAPSRTPNAVQKEAIVSTSVTSQNIACSVFDPKKLAQGPISNIPASVPAELRQLMEANGVAIEEIIYAVSQRGFYPANTPFENYDPEFVRGCLIGAWPQVLDLIRKNREETPF